MVHEALRPARARGGRRTRRTRNTALPAAHPDSGPGTDVCSVLPTQPLDSLDEATITRHAAAIEAGHRPAAVLMSWADQKYVECSYPERFLLNLVLDGHHKLAAYSRLHVPARALLVFRIADSTFTPEERTDFLREVTAPLLTVV